MSSNKVLPQVLKMHMFSNTKRLDSDRTYDVQFLNITQNLHTYSLLHSLNMEHFAVVRMDSQTLLGIPRSPSFGFTDMILICNIFSAPSKPEFISAKDAIIMTMTSFQGIEWYVNHTYRHRQKRWLTSICNPYEMILPKILVFLFLL